MLLSRVTVALIAALAAWVTSGQLSGTSVSDAVRFAVLPSPLYLIASLLASFVLVRVIRTSSRMLLALSALVLLPWLPIAIPQVFYIWTGPLRVWLWTAIAVAALAPALPRVVLRGLQSLVTDSRRAPWLAAAAAASLYAAAAWQISPQLPAGDEPHYLVITQSLLRDRDLRIENNYRAGEYRKYSPVELKPDFLRRGTDDEIYSVHAPGLPILVLPAFALFGYPGVIVFLAALGGLATAWCWMAAWRVTEDAEASWFGWAAVALSVPFFFQSFIAYPDAPGAAAIMFAVLTLMAGRALSVRRLAVTGAVLAALPWLHTRFAIAAGVLGVAIALRQIEATDWPRRLVALLAVPIASALAWFAFFYAIYGTPDPRAPYAGIEQSSLANLPRGLVGLLVDQQFGLLANAPVLACAALGFVALARRHGRLCAELCAVIVPYALAVAAFQMWWGGTSSPARFLVPVVLPLAIPAGLWFLQADRRGGRLLGLAALAVSLAMTVTIALVQRGALLYNARDGASRLLRWLSPSVNISTGLPSVFQHGSANALLHAIVWLAAAAFVVVAVRMFARRTQSRALVATVAGFVAAIGASAALTIVWRINDAVPLTPETSAIALLHRVDPERRQVAVRYSRLTSLPFAASISRMPAGDLAPSLPLADVAVAARSHDRPAIVVENLPAATYAIEADVPRGGAGVVTVTLDRQYGPAWTWNVDAGEQRSWRHEFQLPVAVPAMAVDGSDAARQAIDRLSLRMVRVASARARLADGQPSHVARYGSALMFLMGGHADMESTGVWIGGAARADFVIALDERRPIRVLVRNPPIENRVTLETAAWRHDLAMKPGEEQTIEVPGAPDRQAIALRINAARGARPIEFEKGSADSRLLGVWIELK